MAMMREPMKNIALKRIGMEADTYFQETRLIVDSLGGKLSPEFSETLTTIEQMLEELLKDELIKDDSRQYKQDQIREETDEHGEDR